MSEDMHASAGAYALNAMSEFEQAAFERHLSSCEECSAEVRGFQATAAKLSAVSVAPPPRSLRDSVLAAAAATPQDRSGNAPHASKSGTAVRWLSVAAALMLVTTGALGIATYTNAQRADELAATAASVAEILGADDAETVRGPVEGGGSGAVVVSREHHQAVVVTTGLATPPEGTTYQLWSIGEDGPKSAGLLDTSSDGTAGDVVPWPDDATSFGLTVEPAGGSVDPTTDPVLLLELPA